MADRESVSIRFQNVIDKQWRIQGAETAAAPYWRRKKKGMKKRGRKEEKKERRRENKEKRKERRREKKREEKRNREREREIKGEKKKKKAAPPPPIPLRSRRDCRRVPKISGKGVLFTQQSPARTDFTQRR